MAPAGTEPGSGRTLDRDQMRAYANYQIAQIDAVLLPKHGPAGGSSCRCGRPTPCPQQQSLAETRARYERTLALLDQTQALPMITAPPAARHTRWRSLSALIRKVL
jgi:hypothetical protein